MAQNHPRHGMKTDAIWWAKERAKLLGPESDSEPDTSNETQETREGERDSNEVSEGGNVKRRKTAPEKSTHASRKPTSKPDKRATSSSARNNGGVGTSASHREMTEMERRHHWPQVPDSMFVSEAEIQEKMKVDFSGCAFVRGCDSFCCNKAIKDLIELHGGTSNARVRLSDGNTHVLFSSPYGRTDTISKLVKWKIPFVILPWFFPKVADGGPYADLTKVGYMPDMGMSLLLEAMAVAEIRQERMRDIGLSFDDQEKAWVALGVLAVPRRGGEVVGRPDLGTLPDQLL